jgi:hypothetical protein
VAAGSAGVRSSAFAGGAGVGSRVKKMNAPITTTNAAIIASSKFLFFMLNFFVRRFGCLN